MKYIQKNPRGGFTIRELMLELVVICAAIWLAMPMIMSIRGSIHAYYCENRREMLLRAIKLASGPEADENEIAQRVLHDAAGNGGQYYAVHCACPSDGSYMYYRGSLYCSIHGKAQEE